MFGVRFQTDCFPEGSVFISEGFSMSVLEVIGCVQMMTVAILYLEDIR